jgi:hypothetical protein
VDDVLREHGRCGRRAMSCVLCRQLFNPKVPRYLVLTQYQARSHRAAGARCQQRLVHQAGTGTAKHDQPRRAGLAPDSPARARMSSGSEVQMMTSADGLLSSSGPI